SYQEIRDISMDGCGTTTVSLQLLKSDEATSARDSNRFSGFKGFLVFKNADLVLVFEQLQDPAEEHFAGFSNLNLPQKIHNHPLLQNSFSTFCMHLLGDPAQ
ncbi:hypothetical protein BGZ58_006033, partial [Dissophora ornata]